MTNKKEKTMKRLVMMFVVLAMALTLTAGSVLAGALEEIQKRGKLRVGMEPGYMPFEIMNKKGKIIGFDVDMANKMAEAMDVKVELVNTAWDGIIPALLTGKFDILMSGMTLTQQRNMSINFAQPYIVIGQSVLVSKKLEGTVENYRDLNDPKYTVGSKLGTTGEQAVKRMIGNAKYISYETEQEGVLELINGKVDAFVYDMPYNAIAFVQRGGNKIYHLGEPFTYEPLAWAVKKGDPDFLNWLNNFMFQIKNDGTYEKIFKKWFANDAWLKEIQ
jgi:polar amino acid transport system substrate-binding protein